MSQKLHILFLSSWYPTRVFPTNGDFVQRHAEAVAIKNEVTVVHTVTDKDILTVEIVEKTINGVKTIIAYIPQQKYIFKFYVFLKTYLSIIKKIDDFDLIHLNVTYPKGMIALFLKVFKNKKYIITEHWTDYAYPMNKSIGIFRKLITKAIVKKATYVCPVSKQLQNDMIKFGLNGNYKVIPNVVNTTLFFPVDKTHKTYTITHVSSFNNPQKNITGILNVVKKLLENRKDFVFNIVGNGDFKFIEKYIDEQQIPSKNIQLIKTKTQEEIATVLQKTDLYISFSNYETFGIVMAEAISVGVPVISTNTGILTELNATEFSTIIPVNDEQKLLKTIVDYMNDDKSYDIEKMHQLIKNNFSKDIICHNFTDIYLKTISN